MTQNFLYSSERFKLNYKGTLEHAEQLVDSFMKMRNMTNTYGAGSYLPKYQDNASGYRLKSYPSFYESALSRRYVKAYTSRTCKKVVSAHQAFQADDYDTCLLSIHDYFEQSAIFKKMLQDMSQVLEKKRNQYKLDDVYLFEEGLKKGFQAIDHKDQNMKSLNAELDQKIAALALVKLNKNQTNM